MEPRSKNDIKIGMTVKVARKKNDPRDKWITTTVKQILPTEDHLEDGILVMIHDGSEGYCKEIVEEFVQISEEELERLIENHETINFELKSSFRRSRKSGKPEECLGEQTVREIGAFMNTEGGKICIGVDDLRNVIGLKDEYAVTPSKQNKVKKDALSLAIRSFVSERLQMPITETLFNPYVIPYKGKQVCIIDVKKSDKGVFVLEKYKAQLCDSKGERNINRWAFYVRTGQGTKLYSPYEAKQYWDRERDTDFL